MTHFLSETWRRTFPSDETGAVIQFMRDRWEVIRSRPGGRNALSIKKSEPKITTFFGADLCGNARNAGLLGEFEYEKQRGTANLDTGELDDSIRTDIEYMFMRMEPIPPLIFEFKKLRKSDQRKYYGSTGMLRFITGTYHAHAPHVAFMIGLIDGQNAVDQLKASLKRLPLAVGELHTLTSPEGELVRNPSKEFPNLVDFDTVHSRTSIGDVADLVLCHLFLQLIPETAATSNAVSPTG